MKAYTQAQMITVRFDYADNHTHDKIFMQPLYFVGMNLKQRVAVGPNAVGPNAVGPNAVGPNAVGPNAVGPNAVGPNAVGPNAVGPNAVVDSKLLDKDLNFLSSNSATNHLECASSCLSEQDFTLNYILDRYATDLDFTYKGAHFHIETDKKTVRQHSLKIGPDDHTVTSNYTITFNNEHFRQFEEFMKASVIYFKRFANWQKINKTRIKMFLSTDEGYFQNLGSRSKRSIDSVFLPKKQKSAILKCIDNFINPATISEYKRLGVNHKLTLLLEGVPGTGKSSLITALASHYNFDIAIISFTPKMTDTAFLQILRTWERKLEREDNDDDGDGENRRHTILVIEDMDCIFKERKSNDEARNNVSFSGILNGLDGITTSEHQIVIMTTNHIEHLDPALIRPGRVDYIMKFEHATKEQIMDMFMAYTSADGQQQASTFYEKVKDLNISITTSLLQQYLLKYITSVAGASVAGASVAGASVAASTKLDLILDNVEELKQMYEACTRQRGAELYS
jgi:hypothetical protein